MRRLCSFFISFLLGFTTCLAQEQTITAKVKDSETGELLPYVNVYAQKTKAGTMTNAEGALRIKANADDTLQVSCVGYEEVRIPITEVKGEILLKHIFSTMAEVTVNAGKEDDLLEKVARKFKQEYAKQHKKRKQYFLRQTNWIDGEIQMVESFVSAFSAVGLRDISFLAGRHYMYSGSHTPEDDNSQLLWFSNLQYLLYLSPMVKSDVWNNILTTPFNPLPGAIRGYGYSKRYAVETVRVNGTDGQETIRISFNALERNSNEIVLCGNLYVNALDFRPLRFDGHLENFRMKVWHGLFAKEKPAQLNFHIIYYEEEEPCQIKSIEYTLQCQDIRCQNLLYADARELPDSLLHVSGENNMLAAIEKCTKSEELWTDNIILRTAEEEKLANSMNRNMRQPDIQENAETFAPDIVKRLKYNSEEVPHEKVYLHLDNHTYFIGDTIWFKAYTRQTDRNTPSTISNVLYVELLNHDGYPVKQKIIQMHEGEGNGEFVLDADSSMFSGYYEIRAYTRWQLNWGKNIQKHLKNYDYWFYCKGMSDEFFMDYDKIYSRVVPVYDRPEEGEYEFRDMTLRRTMRHYGKEKGTEVVPIVRFYPEGGEMVSGINNHVAFEVMTEEGEYVEGQLEVNGEVHETVHRGRGDFHITPRDTRPMDAVFRYGNGKEIAVKLPAAKEAGVSMQVSAQPEGWRIVVEREGNGLPDTLGISIMHEGELQALRMLDKKKGTFVFSKEDLDCGVNQVTVFDDSGKVWADRLFFNIIENDVHPTLMVSGIKEEYLPYSRIDFMIECKNWRGGQTRCSVAVREKNTEGNSFDTGSIFTEMLLSSEIKGFVPEPGWYFVKRDEHRLKALDLLMLVQGWRRFDWIFTQNERNDFLPAEKELSLNGEVLRYHPYHKENILELDYLKENFTNEEEFQEEKQKTKLDATTSYRRPSRQQEIEWQDKKQYLEQLLASEYNIQDEKYMAYRGTGIKKIPESVVVHAEFMQGHNGQVRETVTEDGRFSLRVPFMQGASALHLSASDTAKWGKKHRHQWIVPREEEYPEFYVRLESPFVQSVKPYDFYQVHIPMPKNETWSDGTSKYDGYLMKEVSVYAKSGRLIKRMYVPPVIKIDAYEAFNRVCDAGLLDGWMVGKTSLANAAARYFVGDMGTDVVYKTVVLPRLYGGTNEMYEGQNGDAFTEDLYMFQLQSYRYNVDSEGEKYNFLSSLDSVYLYTDFAPRRRGDLIYSKPNIPEVIVLLKGLNENEKRVTFRDRFMMFQGFSIASEFYHPDYGKQIPSENVKDYRRTLYWNPNLMLDENGKASVTLYNNGRTTKPVVDAAGQTTDGTLLWNE